MNSSRDTDIQISLVVATVGRTLELECLLMSITAQNFQGVEVIIVDQNADDRVTTSIQSLQIGFRCVHVRSRKGLSRARNAGLRFASAPIIGFPDDDCFYPDDFLSRMKSWFDKHSTYAFLCCTAQDETGREVASRWPRSSSAIDRATVLRACASASLFIKKTALDSIGGFDETLGLGASTPFQSAEDTDLALRCLESGGKGWFERGLHVCHPYKEAGRGSSSRARAYGMGFGRVLRMHGYSASSLAYHVARALGGACLALLQAQPGEASFYWNSGLGRLHGYLASDGRSSAIEKAMAAQG
jgi:glycosyltransferase involved in cell wall biosynthesis